MKTNITFMYDRIDMYDNAGLESIIQQLEVIREANEEREELQENIAQVEADIQTIEDAVEDIRYQIEDYIDLDDYDTDIVDSMRSEEVALAAELTSLEDDLQNLHGQL